MGADGSLTFDTKIDSSGFTSGLAVLSGNLMTQAVNKIADLGKEALQVGMNFETATSQLAATMGVSKGEITELIETAKELGRTTSFSATEAAEGLNILAQSGLSAQEQMASIGTVLDLAAAGSLSLADAAAYTTGTIKGFGGSMENARYYTDLIAKGATLANTDVNALGEAMSSAAATAGNYGQSADSTALSLLRLAEQNVTGSVAATALNRAMMDLYTPTDEAKKALDSLGISAYDSAGKARDFNTVVDELSSAVAGMSEEEANAVKNTIFTTFGLQAFNKMTVSSTDKVNAFKEGLASASGTSEEYLARVKELTDAGMDQASACRQAAEEFGEIGSAAQQAQTMLENLEGQLTIMGSAAGGLGVAIYESISESLTNLVELGTEAIGRLTEGFKQGGIEGMASAGLEMMNQLMQKMTDAAPMITAKAGELVSYLIQTIQTNAPGMLTAAVNLLASFVSGLAAQLPTLIPQALTMVVTLADAIISNIPTIVQAGVDLLIGLVTGIINSLPTLIQEGPRIINEFCNAIYNGIGTLLGTGLAMIAELGKGIIENLPLIIANAGEIFKAVINVMSLSKMLSLGRDLIMKLGEGIKAIGPTIKEALKNIGQKGYEAIKGINWAHAGSEIIKLIVSSLKSAGSTVLTALKGIGTKAMDAFKNINWGSVGKAVISGIANGITGAAGAIVDAARSAARKALDAAKNFLGIKSPSRVFRDQVGKNMALGIGVGFEKNMPVKDMSEQLKTAVGQIDTDSVNAVLNSMAKSLQLEAAGSVSISAVNTVEKANSTVARQKSGELSGYQGIDYERLGKETAKAMEGMGIYLDKKPVGKIIAPAVNDELGRIDRRKT